MDSITAGYADTRTLTSTRYRLRAVRPLFRFLRRQPLGALGAVIIICLIVVAAAPSRFATVRYDAAVQRDALQRPSADHRFGTDQLGRDIFSRIVYGSRTSVVIGFTAVVLATVAATVLAIVSTNLGGWFDFAIQRLVDIWLAFPPLIFIMLIISVVGQSTFAVVAALTLVSFAGKQRVIRSACLSINSSQYFEAARSIGATRLRLMVRYVLPNVAPVIIVLASTSVGGLILAEASLSFLGFGPPPPFPSWGRMLNDAQGYLRVASFLALFPAITIAATVWACNVFGDALRDVLDPRLKGS